MWSREQTGASYSCLKGRRDKESRRANGLLHGQPKWGWRIGNGNNNWQLSSGIEGKAILYIVLIGLVWLDLACCVNLTSCSLFNKLWLSKLARCMNSERPLSKGRYWVIIGYPSAREHLANSTECIHRSSLRPCSQNSHTHHPTKHIQMHKDFQVITWQVAKIGSW